MQDIKASRDLSVMIKKILLHVIMQKDNAFINYKIKFAL